MYVSISEYDFTVSQYPGLRLSKPCKEHIAATALAGFSSNGNRPHIIARYFLSRPSRTGFTHGLRQLWAWGCGWETWLVARPHPLGFVAAAVTDIEPCRVRGIPRRPETVKIQKRMRARAGNQFHHMNPLAFVSSARSTSAVATA